MPSPNFIEEKMEWSLELSPWQEWRLHNGEENVPEWFIRWSERVRRQALEEAIAEERSRIEEGLNGLASWEVTRPNVMKIINH